MIYRNLSQLFRLQAKQLGPSPALRYKRHGLYHDVSWASYHEQAFACAAALVDAGMQPGDRVGLLSENRLEWFIADMGILAAATVNVPPHAPLTARQVHYQLHDAEVRWLFVSTLNQLKKIEQVRAELPRLEGVVVFESEAAASHWPSAGPTMTWQGFLQQGRRALARNTTELARREAELALDDLATIMYTSGTTGDPKGVMLTHGNLLSNALAANESSPRGPTHVLMNWLPLSHIYARLCDHYTSLAGGTSVSLAESAETLLQNIEDLAPTHIASVPRFYEKVLTAVASPDREKMLRRLRDVFGPRIETLTAGGAPLPRPIAEVYEAAGLEVYQGYGLTETSPIISLNARGHNKLGTVGRALPGVEIKIAQDGEILTRGPHVMKGYWKNPEATTETIRDGWLYTGDLGRLDEDGYLSITGRKKELLVLSNGKKVVPSYIEGLLIGDECIDQAAICGEGRNFLTALLVPQWASVRKALRAKGQDVDSQPETELAASAPVRVLLRQRVDAALANVASWEQVRKFAVLTEPFTIAADELTVSLKLRRNVVLAKHAAKLEALYQDGDSTME
jgi:long-chain acyl-CoA synthetase